MSLSEIKFGHHHQSNCVVNFLSPRRAVKQTRKTSCQIPTPLVLHILSYAIFQLLHQHFKTIISQKFMVIPSIVFLILFNFFGVFTLPTFIRTEWNLANVIEVCFWGSVISNCQQEWILKAFAELKSVASSHQILKYLWLYIYNSGTFLNCTLKPDAHHNCVICQNVFPASQKTHSHICCPIDRPPG